MLQGILRGLYEEKRNDLTVILRDSENKVSYKSLLNNKREQGGISPESGKERRRFSRTTLNWYPRFGYHTKYNKP